MKKIVLFLTATALTALGQAPPAAPPGAAGADLAFIRFQVAPQKGKPVTDLRPEDIEIRVDGAPQKVAFFQGGSVHPRTIPIELSLLFDCTSTALSVGTLSPRLFHEVLLDEFPNVSIAVYEFNGGLSRIAALTRSQEELNKALDAPMFAHPLSTFLLDHISRLALDANSTPGPAIRMLAVFSHGQSDEGSTSATAEQERYQRTIGIAQETGTTIYPVLLIAPLAVQTITTPPSPPRPSSVGGPQFSPPDTSPALRAAGNFTSLGAATGGKRIEVLTGGSMLPTVLKWIAEQIRYEYVAGFQPSLSGEKKRHKTEVVMRNKSRGRIIGGARALVY
jgi:VWFA-related protein